MKRLLFALIMILPIVGMSQTETPWKTFVQTNLFIEWNKYLRDCNELVPDTIRQSGVVNCELVPIKMNGKIISYNQNPTDTVWSSSECVEYKYPTSVTMGLLTSGGGYIWANSTLSLSNTITYFDPKPAQNYFTIKRNKICQIKKRKATFEDFFEHWCVEQKLIKLN